MPTRAPIELLHPPLDRPSGGNVYGRCLLEAARDAGCALSPVFVDAGEVERRLRETVAAFRLWDGLLLEPLARRGPLARRRRGVLLHWLASHDPTLGTAERRRLEVIEDRIVEAATLVVATGAGVLQTLRERHPRTPIALCEPGVHALFLAEAPPPLAPASGSGPPALRCVELLTVANFVPAKGLVETLPVLASLRSLAWRWHLVGDRDVDPECARRFDDEARRLHLTQRIVLHGPLAAREVVDRMDRADLFLFPSRFESYGIALAEAAARALPAVTTCVGAAERLFRDGIDGLLVPVGDSAGLQEALRRSIRDDALRARFRAALRAEHRPREWNRVLAELLAAVAEADTRTRAGEARTKPL